jgi:hypothetical protein
MADRVDLISEVDTLVHKPGVGAFAFIAFRREIIIGHRVRYRRVDEYFPATLAAKNPAGHWQIPAFQAQAARVNVQC